MSKMISGSGPRRGPGKPALLSVATFATVLLLDRRWIGRGFLAEGPPQTGSVFLLRSFLILSSAAFLLLSMMRSREPNTDGESPLPERTRKAILGVVAALSLGFVFIFLTAPVTFHEMSLEDHLIENASALLWVLAAFVFFLSAVLIARRARSERMLFIAVCAGLFCGFLVFAGEEVSWGQRLFNFGLSQEFGKNLQGEVNLHNFATDRTENAFYFGSFVFFLVVPFLYEQIGLLKRWRLSFFIPSRFVLLSGAISVAYNYDMWDVPFTQLSLYFTLLVLGVYTAEALQARNAPPGSRYLPLGWLVLCAGTQMVFLTNGEKFLRVWDVTEYKEMLIPLGFCIYAVEIIWKIAHTDFARHGVAESRLSSGHVARH